MRYIIGVLLVGFVLGAVACTEPEPVVETVTVTASASPSIAAPSETVDEILGETGAVAPSVNAGDARACELMRLAVTREANSPSWIDIVGDATFKAHDYDLQDAIDKAYWTSGDATAAARTRAIVRYCDQQGW